MVSPLTYNSPVLVLVKVTDGYCHLVCAKACLVAVLLFAQQETFLVG